jgi:hypothetical protein
MSSATLPTNNTPYNKETNEFVRENFYKTKWKAVAEREETEKKFNKNSMNYCTVTLENFKTVSRLQ